MSTLMKFQLGSEVFQFEAPGDYPAARPDIVRQVQGRAAGGQVHVEKLGPSYRKRAIVFNLMPPDDYNGMRTWFLGVADGGLNTFTFTDEYGDVGEVRMIDQELNLKETAYQLYSGVVNLEYV